MGSLSPGETHQQESSITNPFNSLDIGQVLSLIVVCCSGLFNTLLRGRWGLLEEAELPVSAFLFLLGHTHNLLRCVLHAVFAQQVQPRPGRNVTWPSPPTRGNQRAAKMKRQAWMIRDSFVFITIHG